jgi:Glycosyl transferase family 11
VDVARTAETLRSAPYAAVHIRRGDYLRHWNLEQNDYVQAIAYLAESEFGSDDFNVAVFSDDLRFVEEHASDLGLDRLRGDILFVRGNSHSGAIFHSYPMSLCPVAVGSIGFFAGTTSLLADPPSVFIWVRPDGARVGRRR